MKPDVSPEATLLSAAQLLDSQHTPYALVGGLAVSVRSEVRFTRDVDFAVVVEGDPEVEELVFVLRSSGYRPIALVEHQSQGRLATARVASPGGVVVDLIVATCGIEREIVSRATPVQFGVERAIQVARAEELLAMKVLSMTEQRLQDILDARNLLADPTLDRSVVRANLQLITQRGYHRDQDLLSKWNDLLQKM